MQLEQVGDFTLYCGRVEDVLPTLPDASVQLIIADPPYIGVKAEAWDRQWPTRDAYLAWLRGIAKEWQRVLTANGSLYCFASPQLAAWVEVTLSETFHVLNRITWRKPPYSTKAEMFEKDAMRQFFPASETILFAEQYGTQYDDAAQALHKTVFAPLGSYIETERLRAGAARDEIDVALGYVRTKNPLRGTELCRRWEEGSSLPTPEAYARLRTYLNSRNGTQDYLRREYDDLRREYDDLRRPFTISSNVPYTDTWDFETVPFQPGKHACEKPLPLLRHIINCSSRKDNIILDCFAGSFAASEAAQQCGRRGIGIEQDSHWWRAGCRRLSQLTLFTEG